MEIRKKFVFLDAENHRVRGEAGITMRNGYPEFTMSGHFLQGWGQVFDRVKPDNEHQKELIDLWRQYHLKDVSGVPNFSERLLSILDGIQAAEDARPNKEHSMREAVLENMEQEGISDIHLDAVIAFMDVFDTDDLSDFSEAYQGEYRHNEDFARDMAESLGSVDDEAEWPHNCIDWEKAARNLMQDYTEKDGYYFRNI